MNRFFLSVAALIALAVFICCAPSPAKTASASATNDPLSTILTKSRIWALGKKGMAYVRFDGGKTYSLGFEAGVANPAQEFATGEYAVDKDTVTLRRAAVKTDPPVQEGADRAGSFLSSLFGKNDSLSLRFEPDYLDIDIAGRLASADGKISAYPLFPSPAGREYTIDGVKVVKIEKQLVAENNVVVRRAPGVSSPRLNFAPAYVYRSKDFARPAWDVKADSADLLLNGSVVALKAKTVSAETVNGLTASWYLVTVEAGPLRGVSGWVFGGYFSDYDPAKNAENNGRLLEELKRRNWIAQP